MAAVSKIEAGVVELRTDVGRLYVRPSAWQRAYLRWTFRNFHTLPQQVLNHRQKRLIETLSRTAIVTGRETFPPTAILGVVEDVRVLALPSSAEMAEPAKPAVAVAKLKVLSARYAELEAAAEVPVESPGIRFVSIPENSTEKASHEAEEIGTPAPAQESPSAGRGFKRTWWAAPVTGIAAAAVLLLVFQLAPLLRLREIQIAQPEMAPPPEASANLKMPVPRAPVPAKPQVTRSPSAPAASPVREAQLAVRNRSGKDPMIHAAATPASPAADAVSLPQIAEAPQSGFLYPVAPNPNLVGKVLLKAVIGSDGTVKQVEVLSGDRALAAAAARAVRHWRYAPAQVDGRAVNAQTHVTVSFLGDDAVSIIVPPGR
jgi:TonB family protein